MILGWILEDCWSIRIKQSSDGTVTADIPALLLSSPARVCCIRLQPGAGVNSSPQLWTRRWKASLSVQPPSHTKVWSYSSSRFHFCGTQSSVLGTVLTSLKLHFIMEKHPLLTCVNWIPVKIQFMSTLLWDAEVNVSEFNGCGVIVSSMLIITCWAVCEGLCIALLLCWSRRFCLTRLFRLWVSLLTNTVNLAVAAVTFVYISQSSGSVWCSFSGPAWTGQDKSDLINLMIFPHTQMGVDSFCHENALMMHHPPLWKCKQTNVNLSSLINHFCWHSWKHLELLLDRHDQSFSTKSERSSHWPWREARLMPSYQLKTFNEMAISFTMFKSEQCGWNLISLLGN